MNKQKNQSNLIIGVVSVVALIAIIGGGYLYYANSNKPDGDQLQTPSNTLATDQSSTTTEYKVMKPPMTSDKDKPEVETPDDNREQPKDEAKNSDDKKPVDNSEDADSDKGSDDQ